MQTLDRAVFGVNFPSDLFQKYVDKWENMPVLYGPQHPDITSFIENPEAELNRVGARRAGHITNVQVVMSGHPRLYADVILTDEYAEGLIAEGHLGLSTGFQCADDGYSLVGEIYPNHVLVFYEDVNNLPADFGAGFLNKQTVGNNMTQNKGNGNGGNGGNNGPVGGGNGTPGTGNNPGIPDEGGQQAAPVEISPEDFLPPISGNSKDYLNLRQKYIDTTNQMQAVNNALSDQNRELKDRIHAMEVRERNNKIQVIIKAIPSEMVKRLDPNTLQDRLNNNPLSVLESVITLYNDQVARLTQSSRAPEGNQFLNKQYSPKPNTGNTGPISTDGLCSRIIVDDEEVY